MTITNEPYRSGPYAGDGSQVIFVVSFVVRDASKLAVYLKNVQGNVVKQTVAVDYTLTFLVTNLITFTVTPKTGESVVILSEENYDQATNFLSGDSVSREAMAEALDHSVAQIKQLKEILDRSLRFDRFSTKAGITVATPEAADDTKQLTWDETNQKYNHTKVASSGELSVSTFAETILDDTFPAEVRTTIGAQSSAAFDAHVATVGAHGKIVVPDRVTSIINLVTSGDTNFTDVVATVDGSDVATHVILRVRILLRQGGTPAERTTVVRLRRGDSDQSGDNIINVEAATLASTPANTVHHVERTVVVPVESDGTWQYEIRQTSAITTNEIEIVQEGYHT